MADVELVKEKGSDPESATTKPPSSSTLHELGSMAVIGALISVITSSIWPFIIGIGAIILMPMMFSDRGEGKKLDKAQRRMLERREAELEILEASPDPIVFKQLHQRLKSRGIICTVVTVRNDARADDRIGHHRNLIPSKRKKKEKKDEREKQPELDKPVVEEHQEEAEEQPEPVESAIEEPQEEVAERPEPDEPVIEKPQEEAAEVVYDDEFERFKEEIRRQLLVIFQTKDIKDLISTNDGALYETWEKLNKALGRYVNIFGMQLRLLKSDDAIIVRVRGSADPRTYLEPRSAPGQIEKEEDPLEHADGHVATFFDLIYKPILQGKGVETCEGSLSI